MAMCTLPGHQPSSKHGLLASPSLLGTNVSGMYLRKTRGQCFSLDSGRKNTPLCPCAAEPAAGNGPKHSPPRGPCRPSALQVHRRPQAHGVPGVMRPWTPPSPSPVARVCATHLSCRLCLHSQLWGQEELEAGEHAAYGARTVGPGSVTGRFGIEASSALSFPVVRWWGGQ